MKKLLFISHPASGNLEGNLQKVIKICRYWWRQGYIPIAPHLLFAYMDNDRDRDRIMQVCYFLIMLCHTVLVYGETKGCREEEAYARKIGKKIIYEYERTNYKQMMEDPGERR